MLVDLHSHVLPSMDDGSDSVETSVAMLRRMGEQGVDTVNVHPLFFLEFIAE